MQWYESRIDGAEQTGIPTHVAEDPLQAIVEGTGKVLNEISFLKKVTSAGV